MFDIFPRPVDWTFIPKLRKAWESYYDKMGLSYNKKLAKVNERIAKGKFPTKI